MSKILSDTDDSDDSDRDQSNDKYKSVSFSPDVEVVEIAPRKKLNPKNKNQLKGMQTDGVKARLGNRNKSADDFLHYTKKIVKLKVSSTKPSNLNKGTMIADDQSKVPVKTRIDFEKNSANRFNSSTSQLASRIKRFSLNANSKSSNFDSKKISTNSSVFARLGTNK